MTIDLSEILPCPNCNSKPRMTGHRAGKPVKIRCSNKSCELSRESVSTGFWQGVNRNGAQELEMAYNQFRSSLRAAQTSGLNNQERLIVNEAANLYRRRWLGQKPSDYNPDFVPLISALQDYQNSQ